MCHILGVMVLKRGEHHKNEAFAHEVNILECVSDCVSLLSELPPSCMQGDGLEEYMFSSTQCLLIICKCIYNFQSLFLFSLEILNWYMFQWEKNDSIRGFKVKFHVLPFRIWQLSTIFSSWRCEISQIPEKNLATCPQPEINHFTSAGHSPEVLMIAEPLRTFLFLIAQSSEKSKCSEYVYRGELSKHSKSTGFLLSYSNISCHNFLPSAVC